MTEIFIGLNNDIIININLHFSMDRVDYCPIRNIYISLEKEDLDHIYDRIETSEEIYLILLLLYYYYYIIIIIMIIFLLFLSKPF